MKHAFWLLIGIGLATAPHAQEIHKCVAGDDVAYQSAPCGDGQVEARVLKLPDYADPPQRDGASAPSFDSSAAPASDTRAAPPDVHAWQAAFPFRTSIVLGMTDDQVLNIPAWGRPSRITRTGRHDGWRETWTYARGDAVRQLAFVNGRLAHVDTETTPPPQLASLTR